MMKHSAYYLNVMKMNVNYVVDDSEDVNENVNDMIDVMVVVNYYQNDVNVILILM